MDPRKEAICNALAAFIRQRPGFDWHNYGDAASYRADVRAVGKDKQQAETLLTAVRWRDSITAEDMLKAGDGGGRLSIKDNFAIAGNRGPLHFTVDYCTGQYWCTEYRAAVARYLASLLWDHVRDHCMPPPMAGEGDRMYSMFEPGHKSPTAVSGGSWLRAHFRKEFGSAIQRRWFN